jgi:uncharacterized protein YicC (UPF0701 family)
MDQEIKQALLRSHQKVLWSLEDEIRRAESARLDAVLAQKLADIAAQAAHEKALADTYNDGYKAGFEAAWRLPR